MSFAAQYTDFLRSLDGMKNWRALGLVIGSFVLAFITVAGAGLLGAAIGNSFFSMLLSLLAGLMGILVVIFGSNAAGVLLMRQILGCPMLPVGDVLAQSMPSFLKLLGVGLLFLLGWTGLTLVCILLLFVCKLPYLGPLLYAGVFPAVLVLSGIAYVGTAFACGLLGPAIWRGASIIEAFRQLLLIVRDHLVETVLRFLLLLLFLLAVFALAYAILFVGAFYAVGLSAAVIGAGMHGGLLAMNSFSGGHGVAMGIGSGVIGVLVTGGAFCAYLMGMISIYLAVSEENAG